MTIKQYVDVEVTIYYLEKILAFHSEIKSSKIAHHCVFSNTTNFFSNKITMCG